MSSFLFILVAEILAHKIRENEQIKGVTINNFEHKICQYADDTETVMLFEEKSLSELFKLMENFEKISGLKVNSDKTEIMKIGKAKNFQQEFLPQYMFKWTTNIKTLGIELWNDLNKTLSRNYTKKISSMKNIINMWSQREVTMYGKILLTKTFILSQFNFLVSCLPSPSEDRIKEIDDMILKFVRSFRSPQKLSKDIIQLDKFKGGLNLTLLKDQIIGLKISWVIRLIKNPNVGWKNIVMGALPLKIQDIWSCNFNKEDGKAIFLHSKNIPYFWKDVIMKWAGYNFYEPKDITDILSQTLWFNSYIKNNKKEMLFFSSWYSEGLFRVKDLFINNKIASYFEITRNIQMQISTF